MPIPSHCMVQDKGDKVNVRIGTKELTLDCTLEKFQKGLEKYNKGTYIQDAFPFLPPAQREFILTGTLPDEWKKIFARPKATRPMEPMSGGSSGRLGEPEWLDDEEGSG